MEEDEGGEEDAGDEEEMNRYVCRFRVEGAVEGELILEGEIHPFCWLGCHPGVDRTRFEARGGKEGEKCNFICFLPTAVVSLRNGPSIS